MSFSASLPTHLQKPSCNHDGLSLDALPCHGVIDRLVSLTYQPSAKPSGLPNIQTNDFLPAVSHWLTFGGMTVVIAIAAAIPVSAILRYKTTVQAPATVRPVGDLRLVQASISGKIQKIFVKSGQQVKKGDIVATLDSNSLLLKQNQLQNRIRQQKFQIGLFSAQMRTFDSQIAAESARNQAAIQANQAELVGSQRSYQDQQTKAITEVAEIEAKLRGTEIALSAAKEKAARYTAIESTGAIAKNEVAEAKLAVRQQEQELAATKASLQRGRAALQPSPAEVAIAEQKIVQEQNSGKATLATFSREKEALIQQQGEAQKQLQQDLYELRQVSIELRQTTIAATADGTISQLRLRNSGQTVQPREEIAQIVPSNAALELKAAVPPEDIGKLKVGQSTQVRISACSYTDYGTLSGTVRQISQDSIRAPLSDSEQSTTSAASKNQAFYEVTIQPNDRTLGRGKNQCLLQLGMEGRADIITKEESVLEFILRKQKLLLDPT
jgi:HlyD family type I secretion membrane fusion protein